MFAIMVFAAGLAAAGLVGSRRVERVGERVAAGGGSANRGLADERGITLQTLIVTAVLVLMAVAAGVVIVAITNSSSDDLEESGTDVQSRCNEVEIYDPVVASRNEIGVNIGMSFNGNANAQAANPTLSNLGFTEFQGSAIGCIPVCVWFDRAPNGDHDPGGNDPGTMGFQVLEPGEVKFVRDLSETNILIRRERTLHWGVRGDNPRSNYVLTSGSSREEILFDTRQGPLPVDHDVSTAINMNNNTHGAISSKIARIAVAPNQQECHTYDDGGNVLLG